jgi:hypothetical protein
MDDEVRLQVDNALDASLITMVDPQVNSLICWVFGENTA